MRRNIYILFAVVLVITAGVTLYIFFGRDTSSPGTLTSNPSSNPFGVAASRFISQFVTGSPYQGGATSTQPNTIQDNFPMLKIWPSPVAGYRFVDYQYLIGATSTSASGTPITRQERATSTSLMFIDRTTGYVYGYDTVSQTIDQITNTLLPGIFDAYIYRDGRRALVRSYDVSTGEVVSSLIDIPRVAPGRDPLPIENTTSLPNNISSVGISSDGTLISYLVPNTNGSSLYTISFDKKITRLDVPLSEWSVVYAGKTPLLVSKPSAYVEGSVLDAQTSTRTLTQKTGLMVRASTKNTLYLASMWSRSGLATFYFNVQTGETKVLGIRTLADKCIWETSALFTVCGVPAKLSTPVEGLPDDWYQGRISFSDSLTIISAAEGSPTFTFNIEQELGEPVDMENLILDANDTLLAFTNKKDGALWLTNIPRLISLQD